jgi:hypothetical protein
MLASWDWCVWIGKTEIIIGFVVVIGRECVSPEFA